MATVVTMQDALLALTNYWTDRGCMIVQPFNTEVGAGTLNPATFLRVLGPGAVAGRVRRAVGPARRRPVRREPEPPADPHPVPGHPQARPGRPAGALPGQPGARSASTCDAHDVRFVEDNWASPALGAWGLGWEVWLDGLEITQFTYFQQAGGMTLDPVSVEITYGIERILMALQGVGHFKDIAYAPGITYGEVFGQAEYEMSPVLPRRRRRRHQPARCWSCTRPRPQRMIDARLPVPAHIYVLKCSHAFNVLDARGAVSTAERAAEFARMRRLAGEVATLWMPSAATSSATRSALVDAAAARGERAGRARRPTTGRATLLFEIGTEELPPAEVARTADAVRARADRAACRRPGSPHGDVRVLRHAAAAGRAGGGGRAARAGRRRGRYAGREVAAAYDADGTPTKAAAGFARGQGVTVADLARVERRRRRVRRAVTGTEPGRPARARCSPELLGEVVAGLRVGEEHALERPEAVVHPADPLAARPAGATQVVPVAVSTLAAGRTTRVLRTAPRRRWSTVAAAEATWRPWPATASWPTRRAPRPDRRRRAGAGRDAGGVIDVDGEAALIDQITYLVEQPTPLLGAFDDELPGAAGRGAHHGDAQAPALPAGARRRRRAAAALRGGGQRPGRRRRWCAPATRRCCGPGTRTRRSSTAPTGRRRWRRCASGLARLTFTDKLGSMADRAARIAALAAVAGRRRLSPTTAPRWTGPASWRSSTSARRWSPR